MSATVLAQWWSRCSHTAPRCGPYDLIVVDDGSSDGSAEILRRLRQRHPEVQVITHPHNRGYGAALKTGIRHTSAELIVITDADKTYPNDRIPELLEWAQEVDMVVGARKIDHAIYPRSRRIAKFFLIQYAAWIVGESYSRHQFRLTRHAAGCGGAVFPHPAGHV